MIWVNIMNSYKKIKGGTVIKGAYLLIIATAILLVYSFPIGAEDSWYISFYAGQSNSKKYIDYFKLSAAPEASYIYVLAGGKTIYRLNRFLTIDVEGLLGQHSGKQNNQEIGLALILRSRFAISDNLNVGIAAGDGLSYASTTPKIETDNSETTSRLLNLLLTEATVGFKKERIDIFFRIHHRSGIFGLVNGIEKGGSNFHTIGVRYYF